MLLYSESELKQELEETVRDLQKKLQGLRTGRARGGIFEDLVVEAYDTQTPLKSLANVIVENAMTVSISPWDPSIVPNVTKAIQAANMGYTPVPTGTNIVINFPPLTEEIRLQTVKEAQARLEEARIQVRQVRQKFMSKVDKAEGVSEDDQKQSRTQIQKIVDEYNKKLEHLAKEKEEEIMTV
jgi:ribosome recycling factor